MVTGTRFRMPRKGFASFRKWAMRTLAVLAAPTCSNKKQGMVLRYLPTYFRRQKMDDNITSLQQAKHAFAKENNIEPCTNDKCGFSGCTCGKKCGCNVIATSEMLETCDPCAEFKRKKAAENACKAREA